MRFVIDRIIEIFAAILFICGLLTLINILGAVL